MAELRDLDMNITQGMTSNGYPTVRWMQRVIIPDPPRGEIWKIRGGAFAAACLTIYIAEATWPFFISTLYSVGNAISPKLANYNTTNYLLGIVLLIIMIAVRLYPLWAGLFVYGILTSIAFYFRMLVVSNDEGDDPYIFEKTRDNYEIFVTVRGLLEIAEKDGKFYLRIHVPQWFRREHATLIPPDKSDCCDHVIDVPVERVQSVLLEEAEPYRKTINGTTVPVETRIELDIGDGETFVVARHFYDKDGMRKLRAVIARHLFGNNSRPGRGETFAPENRKAERTFDPLLDDVI